MGGVFSAGGMSGKGLGIRREFTPIHTTDSLDCDPARRSLE